MWKTLLLVVAGLGAGFAVAVWMQPGYEPPAVEAALAPTAGGPAPVSRTAVDSATRDRLQQLESTLQAEIEQRAALEQRVTDLGAELEALRAPRQARAANGSAGGAPGPDDARLPAAAQDAIRRGRGPNTPEQQIDRLVAAGFTQDRAAWIQKRNEQIVLEQMQAQYTAQRGGTPVGPIAGEQTLRSELGEQDYERYLQATGRPTRVNVFNVLTGSPGERAGLHPGDEILNYAGQRVFDMRDLNNLTLQGVPGETVLVDVVRDGQTLQVAVPRGPIGIGGGAGGFRRVGP